MNADIKFDDRFIPLIKSGVKTSTVRRSPKCSVGDVFLVEDERYVITEMKEYGDILDVLTYWADEGFASAGEMLNWMEEHGYKGPVYLHTFKKETLSDKVYGHIRDNGPCKTSELSRECDEASKTIRECCETHPNLTSIKVRQCNIWLTPTQLLRYKDDIAECIVEHKMDDMDAIVKTLGRNVFERDVLTAICREMEHNNRLIAIEDEIDPREV